MIVCLTPFICVTSFSVFVLSCVCQLCNKEYMMMMMMMIMMMKWHSTHIKLHFDQIPSKPN